MVEDSKDGPAPDVPVINYDAVIVGAGPAGLSAAILLGRCRRQTLVCDSGEYRNARSEAIHAFIGRDGTHPDLLRERGRGELVSYPSVELRDIAVHTTRRTQTGFDVELADGQEIHCRVLLLATGGVDELPRCQDWTAATGAVFFIAPTAMAGNNATGRSPSTDGARRSRRCHAASLSSVRAPSRAAAA